MVPSATLGKQYGASEKTADSELCVSIFHSFETGIANTITASNDQNIFIFVKNRHFE